MAEESGRPPVVTHVDVDEGWEPDDENGGLVRMVREADSLMVGLWKPNGMAGRDIEYALTADETLVVVKGSGELRVDEREPITLRPGVVVSLSRGCRLRWLVDDEFRELWIYHWGRPAEPASARLMRLPPAPRSWVEPRWRRASAPSTSRPRQ